MLKNIPLYVQIVIALMFAVLTGTLLGRET